MSFNLKKFVNIFTIGVFVLITVLIVYFVSFPIVSADSGYYLSIAREFYQAKTYFVDIGTIYNPLAIITIGFPFLFDSEPNIRYHILINIGIILVCGYFFFRLSSFFLNNKAWKLLLTGFFILLLLYHDGRYVILEPLSVVFQLVALLLYLNYEKSNTIWSLFWMGMSISLSFLAKQYGLFILLPIGLSILNSKRNVVLQIAITALGFLVPIIIFYLFIYNQFLGINTFIQCLIGKGFQVDQGNGTGLELDWQARSMFLIIFLVTNLYAVLIPFYANRVRHSPYFILITTTVLVSFSVFYFAVYQHYFIYVIPYLMLFFALIINHTPSSFFHWKSFVLIGLSIGLIMFSCASSIKSKREFYKAQLRFTQQLNQIVPRNAKVYLSGVLPAYYYCCHFYSIDSKKISYTFSGYLFKSRIVQHLDKGEFLVLSKDSYKAYKKITEGFKINHYNIDNQGVIVIQKE